LTLERRDIMVATLPEKPTIGHSHTEANRFLDWTISALEYLPFNDQMKNLIDALIASREIRLSSTEIDGCLAHIESVRTSVRIRSKYAASFVEKLRVYRDQLTAHEEQLKASVKTYWLQ
jgi:hypothetical protein